MGELQRELQTLREREDERDIRSELSLEALEALIAEAGEESARLIHVQAEVNAKAIDKVKCDIRGRCSRGFKFQSSKYCVHKVWSPETQSFISFYAIVIRWFNCYSPPM